MGLGVAASQGLGGLQLLMFHIWYLFVSFLRRGDCTYGKEEDIFQTKEKVLTRQLVRGQKDHPEMWSLVYCKVNWSLPY